AVAVGEGVVECGGLLGGVATCGRQQADLGAFALRQVADQVADRAVAVSRGELVAAEGEDPPRVGRARGGRALSVHQAGTVEIDSGSGLAASGPGAGSGTAG